MKSSIKKFKNGNISIKIDLSKNSHYLRELNKGIDVEKLYNNEMFMNDLYFNQINGYMYLIDFNTQLVYDFTNSTCNCSVFEHLENEIIEGKGKVKLYPLTKKDSKSLMQDLENGY